MPEMALEDLLGALVDEKEGKRGTKIKSISRGGEHFGPGEGSFQMYRTMFGASGHERLDRKDEEFERLWRLVRELELEARGRRRRRYHREHIEGSVSIESGHEEASYQSGSH